MGHGPHPPAHHSPASPFLLPGACRCLCPSVQVYTECSQAVPQPERAHLCFPPQTEEERAPGCAQQPINTWSLAGAPASPSPSRRDPHQSVPHCQSFQTFILPNQATPGSQLSSNLSTEPTLPVAGEGLPGEKQTPNTRHSPSKWHFCGACLKPQSQPQLRRAATRPALESIPLPRQSLLLAARVTARQPGDGPAFPRLPRNSTGESWRCPTRWTP